MIPNTEIICRIISYVITASASGGLVYFYLTHPEQLEKWCVLFYKVINFIFRTGEKKIIAHDIQSRVNIFAKSLKKEIINFEPVGIKIQWITEKESPSDFFHNNKLIIRMREHTNQNKNFVSASMAFISKSLLTKTKRYLSPTQKESVDLYLGKKLFEKEKPQVIDQFFEDFFSPSALSNEKIMDLLEKYEIIDKVGLFFPVLVQELTFLGEKVFYRRKDNKIITNVTSFINFLKNYAEREIGDENTPLNFSGEYCRCGIVIIAKSIKREIGDLKPFIKHIRNLVENKIENIYLIGSASSENKKFIIQVSEEIQRLFNYEIYTTKEFKAKIKHGGERIEVKNYLILHRSPDALRFYDKEYQEKYFVSQ